MKKYYVWVGGVCIYEGNDESIAKSIYYDYITLGYDDVILESEPQK